MKLFADTTDLEEIKTLHDTLFLDGVTTNPTLIAKSGQDFKKLIVAICDVVPGPVSAEVAGTETTTMIAEGERLASLSKNVVVKLPLTTDGLKACRFFSEKGIQTNLTLCFSVTQALLAARAGATFVSPFIGRLDDAGSEGAELLHEIRALYDAYGFETQILSASIRSSSHVKASALAGADAVTAPAKVLSELVKHPLTDLGLEKFVQDWRKTKQEI